MNKQPAKKPVEDPISPRTREETQVHFLRVAHPAAAAELWDKWLTPKDRKKLGNNLYRAMDECKTSVGMFMKARNVDFVEATLHVATYLGLREADRDRLLREWGLLGRGPANDQRLKWDFEAGKLYWGRELIRTVKLYNEEKPSNVQVLIEAFEVENWPEVIDSPFLFQSTLHATIRAVRKGLTRITFSSAAGGAKCRWELLSDRNRRR